jgi:HK97 family phage major capsid protein
MTAQELQEKRLTLNQACEKILNDAEADKRTLNAEERERWDKLDNEAEAIKQTLDRRARTEASAKELATSQGRVSEAPQPGAGAARGGALVPQRAVIEQGEADRREAMRAWFLHKSPIGATQHQQECALRCGINLAADVLHLQFATNPPRSIRGLADWERRAQSIGTTTAGGFTVPEGFIRSLEAALLTFGGMREVATVIRTDGVGDLPIPTANDTAQKGVILAENAQVAEQDITFGQLVLKSFKYSSKLIRVSVELLADSAIDIESFIGTSLGERIGRITNDHFTTGAGTTLPFGIVPQATAGVTGAAGTATSVTIDNLVDLQHSVDPAYRTGARWMFHDSSLKAIKKLKDTQGRQLWTAGLAVAEPDTILGHGYVINNSMAVMAANARSILFGALNKYWIRDVVGITLLRLDERYADFHQVGFLAFSRHDGNLLDAGTNPVKVFINGAT